MNYWIVVRKDLKKPYSDKNLAITKNELWLNSNDKNEDEPRKYDQIFTQIQKGDWLLCYCGYDKEICAVLEAGDKLSDNKGIVLKFKDTLNVPLKTIKSDKNYKKLLSLSPKKYSPFTQGESKSNIFYGSFFAISKAQFYYICALSVE